MTWATLWGWPVGTEGGVWGSVVEEEMAEPPAGSKNGAQTWVSTQAVTNDLSPYAILLVSEGEGNESYVGEAIGVGQVCRRRGWTPKKGDIL